MAASIRVALPDDAPDIAEVHVRAWQAAYADILPTEGLAALDVGTRAGQWRSSLTAPSPAGARCWVAEEGGRVVGFVYAGPSSDEPAVAPGACELVALHLRPGFLGRGLGRGLLEVALARAEEGDAPEMVTWVFEENHGAIRFYGAAGFEADPRVETRAFGGNGPPVRRLRRPLGGAGGTPLEGSPGPEWPPP